MPKIYACKCINIMCEYMHARLDAPSPMYLHRTNDSRSTKSNLNVHTNSRRAMDKNVK